MLSRFLIFLVVNFMGLAIGGRYTGEGVPSEWYIGLEKAPWTPPGWVFGTAWTVIMICFALYMAYLWPEVENRKYLVLLYAKQWILNMIWNPIFFHYHQVALGMFVITLLTLLIGYMLLTYAPMLRRKSVLILPYFLWLLVATSLNVYIYLKN